jgi:hypothetical protein
MSSTGSSSLPAGPPLYNEVQRFRQWWLWVLVAGVAALAWWAFVRQIVLGQPLGDNPSPDWGVWLLWVFIGLGLPFLFLYLRLVLEVFPDLILVRFRPLHSRTIPLAEVKESQVRQYSAVKEYGGWGIKGWSQKKVAYNVSGNEGVELTLHDGRSIMLGSQRAPELAQAIERARGRVPGV